MGWDYALGFEADERSSMVNQSLARRGLGAGSFCFRDLHSKTSRRAIRLITRGPTLVDNGGA